MQSPERTPIDTTADLDWTAFRYVIGELAADEACRFEEQLAIDQLAREAVASAARLTSAVAQGFPAEQVAPVRRRSGNSTRKWNRIGWLVASTAASVACFFLVRDLRNVPREDVAAGRMQNLATAWVASRSAEPDANGPDASNTESAIPDTVVAVTPTPEAEPDMSTVPDWLLAAVSEKVMAEQADAPKPAPDRAIEN